MRHLKLILCCTQTSIHMVNFTKAMTRSRSYLLQC